MSGERAYYQFYTHEPVVHNSNHPFRGWELIDTKLPLTSQQFNPENPDTYMRLIFHPFTGKHMLVSEQALLKLRENGTPGDHS